MRPPARYCTFLGSASSGFCGIQFSLSFHNRPPVSAVACTVDVVRDGSWLSTGCAVVSTRSRSGARLLQLGLLGGWRHAALSSGHVYPRLRYLAMRFIWRSTEQSSAWARPAVVPKRAPCGKMGSKAKTESRMCRLPQAMSRRAVGPPPKLYSWLAWLRTVTPHCVWRRRGTETRFAT